MRDWTKEEIQFIREYYADYPIKEIAAEIKRSIKSVNIKANELGIVEIVPEGFKKCIDCNNIKPLNNFHSHSTDKGSTNSYCKPCDYIRRKKNALLKKEKEIFKNITYKLKLAAQFKIETASKFYECKKCSQKKIGKDFYFDSSKLKRNDYCIVCYLNDRKEKEIKKILERGY